MAAEMTERYEYEIHSIGFSGFMARPQEDHGAVIARYAERGWRLLQILIIPTAEGAPRVMDLVFERRYRGPQDRTTADGPSFEPEPLFRQPGIG